MNSLGRLALAVRDQVNSQQTQGLDLKGEVGAALFGDFNAASLMDLRATPFSGNTSAADASLKITDTGSLTLSDYRLEFDGTNYSARRLSDSASITVTPNAGPPAYLSFADSAGNDQGFTVGISGTPQAGDKFSLQPTRRGATDIKSVLDQADQLAFAAPVQAQSNLQNAGTGVISQPETSESIDIAALKAALPADITLTYNSGSPPTISGAGVSQLSPAEFTPGQTNELSITIDGNSFTFTVSGRPQDGDTFTIGFNQNGVSDNRNALKMVDLQSSPTVGVDANVPGSGKSFTDGYGELVERVGTLTAQARMDSEATGAILKQATDNRDSLSAVNLDEEAANLIKFEQYYNASAQIIQVARSLFDTLISTFR